MKKFFKVLFVILAIISLLAAAFLYFKLYMQIQVINKIECDGFGDALVRGKPHSTKTLFMYGFVVLGFTLFSISTKFKNNKEEK